VTDDAPSLRVRRGRPADRPALRRLQSFLQRPSPQLLSHALDGGVGARVLVSTGGAGAAGEETQRAAADAPVGYLLAVDGADVHVAELAVAPDYRRQGRAGELLDALLATTASGRRVTLAVSPENNAALALYRSRGFERIGRREDFYDGAPALLLARQT